MIFLCAWRTWGLWWQIGSWRCQDNQAATYQTCNWLILLSRGIICKYAVSRLNAMILFPAASPPACLLSFLNIGFASKMWPDPFWSRIRAHPLIIPEMFDYENIRYFLVSAFELNSLDLFWYLLDTTHPHPSIVICSNIEPDCQGGEEGWDHLEGGTSSPSPLRSVYVV